MQFLLNCSLIFFIINSIMTPYIVYAMIPAPIAEIPMSKALHVAFLPDNILAIAADISLIFYDLDSNTETEKKIYEHSVDDIAVNKTGSRLAISCHGKIELYDTKTQKCDDRLTFLFTENFIPITFNSQKDDQLIMHPFCLGSNRSQLTFSDNQFPIRTYKRNTQAQTFITCHPDKEEIIYISSKFLVGIQYQCFCLQSIATTEHKGVVVLDNEIDVYASKYQYSPNAQYILINQNERGLHFKSSEKQLGIPKLITCNKCDSNTHSLWTSSLWTHKLQFSSAIFHPNGTFFVTLSHRHFLEYWICESVLNQNSPQPDFSISLCTENNTFLNTESLQKRLSFSLDGTHLAIALPDKCLVLPVPTSVIISSFDPELQKIILLLLSTKNKK